MEKYMKKEYMYIYVCIYIHTYIIADSLCCTVEINTSEHIVNQLYFKHWKIYIVMCKIVGSC